MQKTIAFLLLTVWVSGCTTIPTNLTTFENAGNVKNYLKKNSIIFGRLVADSPGYFINLAAENLATRHKYVIMAPPARKLFSPNKEDNRDGYYFSVLPPGNYRVYRLIYSNAIYSGSFDVDMNFAVPENSAVYLGAVVFSWQTNKNYLIYQKGNVYYSIHDEHEDAINRLWRRFPELKEEGLNVKVEIMGMGQIQK